MSRHSSAEQSPLYEVRARLLQVLTPAGVAAGTAFELVSGIAVTAAHVVADVYGSMEPHTIVRLCSFDSRIERKAAVIRADHDYDVCVLEIEDGIPLEMMAAETSDSLAPGLQVALSGAGELVDPGHTYKLTPALGTYIGPTDRDDLTLSTVESKQVLPGMSGAPVVRADNGALVGMLSARYNSEDGWHRDTVWIVRPETVLAMVELAAPSSQPHRAFALDSEQDLPLMFNVPPLPTHFVDRPDLRAKILDKVLRPSAFGSTVSIFGFGGHGKSSLVAAICRERHVQAVFPGGIFWVSLGRVPDVEQRLTEIFGYLTGERPGWSRLDAAVAAVSGALSKRRVLLVLDDARETSSVEFFVKAGAECTRLLTTRYRHVAETLSAADERMEVEVMTPAEAVQMLTAGLAPIENAEAFTNLAASLGEWPILLSLAAALIRERVADNDDPEAAVAYVANTYDRGRIDDGWQAEGRSGVARNIIDSTIEQLLPDDRGLFQRLAVLPQNVDVPFDVLAALWDTGVAEVEQLVGRLARLSLVRRDLGTRTIHMHDVVRDDLDARHDDDEKAKWHARVLVGLGGLRSAKGPAGHYAWEWYCHHLYHSGGQVENVLLDFSWLAGKLSSTDSASLLADFEFAKSLTSTKVVAAIRQCADVLARDPTQLGPQLLARLGAEADDERIARLLEGARAAPGARLEPRWPCMTLGTETEAVLRGHTDKVWSAAQLPDGRVVTGGDDATIRLVDLARLPEQVSVPHHGGVWALTVLEDGRLVSGGKDGIVRIWRAVPDGLDLEREFVGHESDVDCVLQLDEGAIVSGGHDATARIWNIANPRQQPIVMQHDGIVWGLARLPDGRIISASADRTARVWDRLSGRELTRFIGHANEVNAIAVLPSGQVATCSDDATIRIWDPDTGAEVRVLRGHTGGVCAILADGTSNLYSGGVDRVLRKWDWRTEALDNTFQGHSADINALVRLKNGRILTASDDQTSRVWDCSVDTNATAHLRHSGAVLALAIHDGLGLVSGGTDGRIRLWDHLGGLLLAEADGRDRVDAIDVTRSAVVVFGGSGDSVGTWSGRPGDRPTVRAAGQGGVLAVTALSGGGVASAGTDGTVAIRSDDLQCVSKWTAHDGPVHAIVDLGQGLVATCGDDRIRVFSIASSEQVALVSRFEGDRCSLARAIQGDLLIGRPDGLIRRWSPNDQRERTVRDGAHGVERGLCPVSSHYLAAAAGDASVGVVDIASGQLAAQFTGDAEVLSVASGRGYIAAGASSGAIYVLDLVNLPAGGLNASGPRDLGEQVPY